MAIDLTLKSGFVTNREAVPAVLNSPGAGAKARMVQVAGYYASVPASLSATSIIRMVEVPSNAVITSVKVWSGAQTAGKFNVGLYNTNKNGGALVIAASDSFFTTDLDCSSAVAGTECVFGTGTSGNSRLGMTQPIWQAVALGADPGGEFDVSLTVHTTDVTTGTGSVLVVVQYVVG